MKHKQFIIEDIFIKSVVSDIELDTVEKKQKFEKALYKNDMDRNFEDEANIFQEYLEDNVYLTEQKLYIKNKWFIKEFEYIEVNIEQIDTDGDTNYIDISIIFHYTGE